VTAMQRHLPSKAVHVGPTKDQEKIPFISAYYTYTGSGGVIPEKEYWQLVEAYKSWVYRACDKIAKTVATVPMRLFVYRSRMTQKIVRNISWKFVYRSLETEADRNYFVKNQNFQREEVIDHPYLDLLRHPNDLMTRFSLWYNTMVRLELSGLVGWLKIRDRLGVTRRIIPLPATKYARLRPKVSSAMELQAWEYQDGDIRQKFNPDEVFPMIYPHPASPFQGMSPLMAQIIPYDLDLFLMQQQKAFFQRGANPGMILTTDQKLNHDQISEIQHQINEKYAGALMSGETMVLHSGFKHEKLGQTGRENLLTDVANFARDKLLTAYDLSPGVVGIVDDVNRASMKGLKDTYILDCIRPKCYLMEEAQETWFLPDYDEGLTCEFDLPSTDDEQFKLRERESNLKTGFRTINEERVRHGEEPVPWGDRPWLPGTMIQVGDAPKPQPGNDNGDGKDKVTQTKMRTKITGLTRAYWTEEKKDAYWKVFAVRSEHLKDLFLTPIKRYFRSQRGEVLKRLNSEGRKIAGQYAGWSRQRILDHIAETKKANIRAININKAEERRALTALFEPVYKNIMTETGDERIAHLNETLKANAPRATKAFTRQLQKSHKTDMGDPVEKDSGRTFNRISTFISDTCRTSLSMTSFPIPEIPNRSPSEALKNGLAMSVSATKAFTVEFDVNDPQARKWLGSRLRQFSRQVTGTTFDEIEAILREGFSEGLPIVTISERLSERFDSWEQWRAPLIARTETMAARNFSDLNSVSQMGLEDDLLKFWLSARDDHCRDTHAEADEKYRDGIPIDEDFQVGADTMPCPGAGSLPEEVVNCRCTIGYLQKGTED